LFYFKGLVPCGMISLPYKVPPVSLQTPLMSYKGDVQLRHTILSNPSSN